MDDMIFRGQLGDAVQLFNSKALDCETLAIERRARAAADWEGLADMSLSVETRNGLTSSWAKNTARAEEYDTTAKAFRAAAEHLTQKLAFADAAFAAQLRAQLAQLGIAGERPVIQG